MDFPFNPFNISAVNWVELGIKIAKPIIILIAWYISNRFIRYMHDHTSFIDRALSRGAKSDKAKAALEGRVKTFKSIFVNIIRLLNSVFFIFVLLGAFGIDPAPILAGIGVVGLGLSLGAQNILRDFINGFFIIIEDQFNIGDSVSINGVVGTVESLTMRTTRLRKLDGAIVVIPNGIIGTVENDSKEFSVAVVLIPVPYGADFSRVVEALEKSAERLREADPTVAKENVQGIVEFRQSDMVIRVTMKTHPGAQWGVEREYRRMVLEEFAAASIEPPFPHTINRIVDERTEPSSAR